MESHNGGDFRVNIYNYKAEDLLTCIVDHQIFKKHERYYYKDIVAHKVFKGGDNLTLAEIKTEIIINFQMLPLEISFEGYIDKIFINSEIRAGFSFDRGILQIKMDNGVVLESITTKLPLFRDPDKYLCVGKRTRVKITLTEILE